jgi:hypothetical protein
LKRSVIIFFLFLLSLGIFQPVVVEAGIKKTTADNVIHYELDAIKLQGVETQDPKSQLYAAPYKQKDCKVKLKAQSQLVHGQYHICLVLNLENPDYQLGNCHIWLVKFYQDMSYDQYVLFPLIENYNFPPTMQWVRNLENAWGIKYPYTSQFDCYEGQSKYELYFLLTLADFEDLITSEDLGLFINLNHSTLSYQIKNMKELRELKQKIMAVAKQPVPTNNAPVYSLKCSITLTN